MDAWSLIKPLVFRADAERAHDAVIAGLGRVSRSKRLLARLERTMAWDDPRLQVSLFGHQLSSPLMIAAGLDKNGRAVAALHALGFALTEVGTVTPLPQAGNDKPRVFRLPDDEALINRMGFPGAGVAAVARNLAQSQPAPFAINVGPNKDRVEQAAEECLTVIRRLALFRPAYVVVNVSSPNTAHLRSLQGKAALEALLGEVKAGMPAEPALPLLVKIAPDLSDRELDDILGVVADVGLDGIVATNTTTSRPRSLTHAARIERGGLSGRPLAELSDRVVARIAAHAPGRTLIAAGGVMSGADAARKIALGATAVQLYTGFVYGGPSTARTIKQGLAAELDRRGLSSLADLRGSETIAGAAPGR